MKELQMDVTFVNTNKMNLMEYGKRAWLLSLIVCLSAFLILPYVHCHAGDGAADRFHFITEKHQHQHKSDCYFHDSSSENSGHIHLAPESLVSASCSSLKGSPNTPLVILSSIAATPQINEEALSLLNKPVSCYSILFSRTVSGLSPPVI